MKTEVTELLGIEYPIIQGGMAWVAEYHLAAGVSNAGGLGLIGAASAPAEWVREQIREAKKLTDKPFGVNIMLISPYAEDVAKVVAEEGVKVVTTGAGSPEKYMKMWKEAGIKVIPVVASVALARRMERCGADAVVAEGTESGGHIGETTTMALVPQVVDAVQIPVIAAGNITPYELLTNMGSGASGMFETCMVAVLVAAMCALIREYGGFEALLSAIYRTFKGKRGGLLGMGLLVGLIDIATANNTVAIVMANPIAKEMAQKYGITSRKTASILDTFSCIFQAVIPYGAQMLVAISAVHELGHEVSAFNILPYLFYPMFLLVSSLVAVFVVENGRKFN